jgi:hypothetical protein
MKHQTKTITATLADHQWIEPATLATATLLCTLLGFYAQQFAQKMKTMLFFLDDWVAF